jgi:hypothetical protein
MIESAATDSSRLDPRQARRISLLRQRIERPEHRRQHAAEQVEMRMRRRHHEVLRLGHVHAPAHADEQAGDAEREESG